ncbi:MAG: PIN domain-containing protein [Acidobacteriota bacterium]
MVLVDTSIWSLSLRRRAVDLSPDELQLTRSLYELVRQGRVQLLGSIRQEVLCGIREESQFRRIRDHLHDFPDAETVIEDFEEAARGSNLCRQVGVATSPVDMLMCALALRHDWEIFTTDRDFVPYRNVLRIRLFAVPQHPPS